jgi:hypothetical protein
VDFEAQLMSWCQTPPGEPFLRPFAPNPAWRDAQVFIIGTNPATPLRDEFPSFDAYWRGLTLDPQLFYLKYERKHQGGTSKTTDRVRELINMLSPITCLVTNASWIPAASPKDIKSQQWREGSDRLKELIRYCHPKVLFCHGAKACAFARSLGANVDPYELPSSQSTMYDGMLVLAYHHFTGQGLRQGSRFDPSNEVPQFATRIRSFINDAQQPHAPDRLQRASPASAGR